MPTYIFQHPVSKEYKEIIQGINDEHIYKDEYGVVWNRIFTIPQLNTEGTLNVDCTDKQFAEFTKNKKGTIGDLWDRSSELSEKRKKIYGEDPLKKKYVNSWKKKRKGKRHPTLEN